MPSIPDWAGWLLVAGPFVCTALGIWLGGRGGPKR